MLVVTKKYLNENQYQNQIERFEDDFLSHPNYPSLYAITDSLNLSGIENIAVKIQKEQLNELPKSFLTFFKNEFVLIRHHNTTISIQMEHGGRQEVSYDDFCKNWNPIILAIEPNQNITNSNTINFKSEYLYYSLLAVMLCACSLYFNSFTVQAVVSSLIALSGIVVSVFILQEQLGIKTEIGSKFCNLNANTSCKEVVKSDASILVKSIGFADIALLFFVTNFLTLCIHSSLINSLVYAITTSALPVVAYTLWLQKFKLKKWCPLCLVISSLLIIQSAIAFGFNSSFLHSITVESIVLYVAVGSVIGLVWFKIKALIKSQNEMKPELNALKRFKKNYKIFKSLQTPLKTEAGLEQLKGITFGHATNPIRLDLILSPSCRHCHKAFKDGLELVKKHPNDYFLSILFNINSTNNDNPYLKVVNTLLERNIENPKKAQEAIVDWHIEKVGLDTWIQKWQLENISMQTHNELYKQYEWCLENEFNYTPVKILDNKLFPEEYQLSELQYLTSELRENTKIVVTNELHLV